MHKLFAAAALASSLAACSHGSSQSSGGSSSAAPAVHQSHDAFATLDAKSGSKLVGSARFTRGEGGGISAHIVVANAASGLHGVHIHEKGDCSDDKAANAGGHFNPAGAAHHGGPAGTERHGGDLGNISVDDKGNGQLDVTVSGLNLDGDERGIVGRAIVVHEKEDDLHSDPSGNSGARIGCGVIQAGAAP